MAFIPVNTPSLQGNEKKYLTECIESGWISSEGPFVKRFENDFSAYIGKKYGIAVSSGSGALDIAVAALGIGPGDEVIMPAFTIISCAASVIRAGAIPVLTDSDIQTWNMQVQDIESKITEKTKAIMVVHMYGLPVDMDPLIHIARKYNLKIIEDAAEAHGLKYCGKRCGGFGDISIFSFYPNKHITTGEGGMLLTDDENLADRCKSLRNLCFQSQKRFFHEELGWNYRMTNMQAALGVAQLEQIENFLEKKKRLGAYYLEAFEGIEEFHLPVAKTEYAENVYWVFGIVLNEKSGITAAEFCEKLSAEKIGTRPFFWPMHRQPVFKKAGLFTADSHPVSEYLSQYGFYIPSGLGLTDPEQEYVAETVKKIIKK